jgi:hypothetical protein
MNKHILRKPCRRFNKLGGVFEQDRIGEKRREIKGTEGARFHNCTGEAREEIVG